MNHFDVIAIGGGPGGERAAVQAAKAGRRAAIVERERVVGGTCINWGAIPSKTLRESALFVHGLTRNRLHGIRCELPASISVPDFMYREQVVVQRELELLNRALRRYAVEVFEGHGRLVDEHTVAVVGRDGRQRTRLRGDVIVLATGTTPHRPADVPFDEQHVFDSDTILKLPHMPRSMVVLGAGVIGTEYGAIFAALGLQVTLVDTRPALLPYLDREIAELLRQELRRLGVVYVPAERYARIERVQGEAGEPSLVRCHTRTGNVLEADVLLYCVGRDGNTANLGLDVVGLEANERGLLKVDGNFRTAVPHIYAVGDLIGYPALASTSMEQGRQAMRHAFDIPGPMARTAHLPFAIYSIPEVSYIGLSEEAATRAGQRYVVGRGRYDMNPRGQISGDTGGLLKLLFAADDLRLVGAHMVGQGASELIHVAQGALQSGTTATALAQTLFNYPTLADLYRHAALDALRAHSELGEGPEASA